MSVSVDAPSEIILGDSLTITHQWTDDGIGPAVRPTSYNITADDGLDVTIAGTNNSYTYTPTTVGNDAANGYDTTSFAVRAYQGSTLTHLYYVGTRIYTLPTLTLSNYDNLITPGESSTITWSTTGDFTTLMCPEISSSPIWNLYGGTPGQPRTGTRTVTPTVTTTYNFTVSHSSPPAEPAIASRLTATDSATITVYVAPVYGISAAKTLYTEGETMYCAVTTTNVSAGTTVYWAIEGITGTLTGSDFVGPINGGFQLDSNGGFTWSVGINNDTTVEPSEMFRLKLYTDASRTILVAQSAITTILASDQPSYTIGAAKSVYNEGETVYCAVVTSNVAIGTTLYWKITGAGVNEQDWDGALQGTGITNSSGQFTFSRTLLSDQQTENTETFKLELFTDGVDINLVAESPLYTILDTSPSVSYLITPSSLTVVEGGSLTYTVETTGYPTGTVLYWAIEGVGITGSDFSPTSITGSAATDGNGAFDVTRTIYADSTTEGNELIYFRVMYPTSAVGDIVSTNTQVSILDTSTDPPPAAPTINFTASSTNINSGQGVTLVWNVSNSTNTIINQGIGSVPNSSTQTVYPTTNITYTLTATGPGGTNSATVTIDIAQPVVLNVTGPSQIDWQDSPIPINITASNSPGIILYETYDGVVKPSVSIPNSSGTVSLIPYNYIPDWSSPVSIIQLHFAAGASANNTLVISVGVDRTPDPITIPTTLSNPNEDVISPLVAVEVQDIDVPIEIKANQPIQVQVGGNTNWEDVREG